MRTTTILLGLALLLAGCLEGDDSGTDGPSTSDDGTIDPATTGDATGTTEGDDTGNTDATGANGDEGSDGDSTGAGDAATDGDGADDAPNTPPTTDLQADVASGTVPFDVNFTLAGADADGDVLSWTFDADGDGVADTEGSGLPFNFTFSYTETGNHSAVLTVTDGAAEVNETLVVEAVEAAAEVAEESGVEFPDDPTCKTQTEGVTAIPGGFYVTDDPLPYIYEEANGVPGLQRDPGDSAASHPCQNPDIYHF